MKRAVSATHSSKATRGARELRGEFHDNASPGGNEFIQGIQSRSIGDCKGEMIKAEIRAPVKRDRSVRRPLAMLSGDYRGLLALVNETPRR